MHSIRPRGGSAIAQLRRVSIYATLSFVIALALAAAAKIMHGQSPARGASAADSRPGVSLTQFSGDEADSIRAIIRRDLDYSDRVRIASTANLVGNDLSASNATPADYARFARIGAAYVVDAKRSGPKLTVWLFDIRGQRVAQSREYDFDGSAYRAVVHTAAADVEEAITGQRGLAESRIAYIHGGKVRVVDADGANDRAVTTSGAALSPAWHPSGRSIVYSDLGDAGTQVTMLDLETGRSKPLNATPRGLNITPVFTPDGANVVYASGGEQPADLVIASRNGGRARKMGSGALTEQSSPTFSPDGRRVAFISPSPRTPQIYTMNVDGTDIQQLTPTIAGVRSYRTGPDWSPDGRAIAYEQQNGDFQVWMITLTDRKIRRLTSIGENEDPSWAPDARHLVMATTRRGSKNLWVLDTKTGRLRQLTHNNGARLAAWSPRSGRGEGAILAAGGSGGGR